MNKMNLSKHLSDSLDRAKKISEKELRLLSDAFFIKGMSALRIRLLLNELVSHAEAKYLEVGVHTGSTFIPAIYQNSPRIAYAVDDWSQFRDNHPSIKFAKNCKTHLGQQRSFLKSLDPRSELTGESTSRGALLLNKNIFETNSSDFKNNKFNIYFYDGDHTYPAQYKALEHMININCLEDEFIFLVDDYLGKQVRSGTQAAIEQLNLKVVYEEELGCEGNHNLRAEAARSDCDGPQYERINPESDSVNWWNGFYASLLRK